MILVTGGTGLVGAHLLYNLSRENNKIRAIHRKNSDLEAVKKVFSYYCENFDSLFQKIEWVEADILDIFSLEIAFQNVSEVYHSAGFISFNPKEYIKLRKINIGGTANVVNCCIDNKIKKLCYVSSIASLGKSIDNEAVTESNEWDLYDDVSGYAISKHGGEMEVWRASQEGVPVVIVNPGIILGSGFWDSGSGKLFSTIFNGLNFYTEGVTGYVSVKDVVKVMVALMKSNIKNERYILVSENKTYKNVFFKIAESFGRKRPKIKITRFLSSILWPIAIIISKISGKSPFLTRHSSKSIHQKTLYSSEKVTNKLDFQFENVEDTIEDVCKFYPNISENDLQ